MKKRGLFLVVLLVFSLLIPLSLASTLKVTSEHPFLLNGEWIEAKDLKQGDILKTYQGKKVKITSIQDITLETPIPVYNLEAFPYHDFIVEDGLVVHNSHKNFVPCFAGNTPILMADGSEKQIKDIKPGEKVLSWDFNLQKLKQETVTDISITENAEVYLINSLIEVTADHPFWTKEIGWASIDGKLEIDNILTSSKLKIGYHLMTSKGELIKINSIEKTNKKITVYNLIDVTNSNNYFAHNILVHNQFANLCSQVSTGKETYRYINTRKMPQRKLTMDEFDDYVIGYRGQEVGFYGRSFYVKDGVGLRNPKTGLVRDVKGGKFLKIYNNHAPVAEDIVMGSKVVPKNAIAGIARTDVGDAPEYFFGLSTYEVKLTMQDPSKSLIDDFLGWLGRFVHLKKVINTKKVGEYLLTFADGKTAPLYLPKLE